MGAGPGYSAFKLAFELSPIVFVNGIAGAGVTGIPGGMLPIIALTQGIDFVLGLTAGASTPSMDDFFAHFAPLPGSTLFEAKIGTYPLANTAVAGNAIIQQPTNLSMIMRCPARGDLGYGIKLVIMTALQLAVQQHATLGGTYIIATPASIYTNGILLRMEDVSDTGSVQVQNAYKLDFYFPLLTLSQAQSAQNTLMSKISGGATVPSDGNGAVTWSGVSNTTGAPNSLAAPSIIPSGGSPGTLTSPMTQLVPGGF